MVVAILLSFAFLTIFGTAGGRKEFLSFGFHLSGFESDFLFDSWLPNYKAKQFGALLFRSLGGLSRVEEAGKSREVVKKSTEKGSRIISTSPPFGFSYPPHHFLLYSFALDTEKVFLYFFKLVQTFPPTFDYRGRSFHMMVGSVIFMCIQQIFVFHFWSK